MSPCTSGRAKLALLSVAGLVATAAPVLATAPPASAASNPVYVNVVATNDFHGRIRNNGIEAGAAAMAGAVDQMRETWPNTVFAAAGDLIGASTFESFVQNDKPTIDALNAAGLEVSAAGNHEFDKGYDDLVNRVMAPESADNPDGGAEWQYIASNLTLHDTDDPALEPSFVKTFGTGANEVEVGFVGAVTEHLPELVSPAGIEDIDVNDIVTSVNTEADALKAGGADIVVMLVHEGAPSTDCAAMDDDPTSDFGSIITGVDQNVDAIVSGHTHLAYNCKFPVAAWQTQQRPVTERPVVSAGQYGYNLNRLGFTYDTDPAITDPNKRLLGITQNLVSLTECTNACNTSSPVYKPVFPANQEVAGIVSQAVTQADVLGAQELGKTNGFFGRAQRPKLNDPNNGKEENRGGESTLGNFVAEVQRWATSSEESGAAELAFMNPGGLRADLPPTSGNTQRTITYKQAANVQPFANTLVNMTLTGAQIRTVLEQQWQPAGSSRPFLRLGTSQGFRYTYDPDAAAGSRILDMYLDDEPIADTDTFSVTVNSFLASGGDNFLGFKDGTGARDTGKADLQAMVDYMAEFGSGGDVVPVDFAQHAVGIDPADGAPETYAPGDTVAFDVSSLAMTAAGDLQDSSLDVSLGDTDLGSAPVDNTVATGAADDESGRASVSVTLPDDTPVGDQVLTLTGATTGTVVSVPITVEEGTVESDVTAVVRPDRVVRNKTSPKVKITVTVDGQPADGDVTVKVGGRTWEGTVTDGAATVVLDPFKQTGTKTAVVDFEGGDVSAGTTVDFKVVKK